MSIFHHLTSFWSKVHNFILRDSTCHVREYLMCIVPGQGLTLMCTLVHSKYGDPIWTKIWWFWTILEMIYDLREVEIDQSEVIFYHTQIRSWVAHGGCVICWTRIRGNRYGVLLILSNTTLYIIITSFWTPNLHHISSLCDMCHKYALFHHKHDTAHYVYSWWCIRLVYHTTVSPPDWVL